MARTSQVETLDEEAQGFPVEPEETEPSAKLLGREVLSLEDRTYEYVNVPEWGGKVRVQSLDARQRAYWQERSLNQKGKNSTVNFQLSTILLVALTWVDEKGSRVFQDADLRELGRKNSAALERIADVAMALSGIGEDEMDQIRGNSETSLNGDSL